jgi:hypothetical protein
MRSLNHKVLKIRIFWHASREANSWHRHCLSLRLPKLPRQHHNLFWFPLNYDHLPPSYFRLVVQILATSRINMALRAGKFVQGATGTYKLLNALKAPTVYKAQVLLGPCIDKRWYVFITVPKNRQLLTLTIRLWLKQLLMSSKMSP